MKQISSLELHFLAKEFQILENSRVDKIYNNSRDEIYLQFHKSNVGKKDIEDYCWKSYFF